MIIANLSDGSTQHFDLQVEADEKELRSLTKTRKITALSILRDCLRFALPLPKKFRSAPTFGAELFLNKQREPIGERIYVLAGEVQVSLSLPFDNTVARCDLVRIGRIVYNGHG